MKNTFLRFTIAILLLGSFNIANAQRNAKPKSTIKFVLSDGTPLTLAINGRYYKKVGTSVTLGDLPGKRPYIKVYKFRAYADGKGGKAELMFEGKIKITPGNSYLAKVDVNSHQLILNTVSPASNDTEIGNSSASPAVASQNITNIPSSLTDLIDQMNREDADLNKLKLAKNFVDNNNCTINDLSQIGNTLLFDDTKLSFLKYAYNKSNFKSSFNTLSSILTTDEAKQTFTQFLKAK